MEPLASRPEVLAVALVVESSIAVAAEWPRIIIEYVAHILKRLSDANPSHRLRIGFVTYATASTVPSPVLCKRFFTDFPVVMKEMREDPTRLGIGQTNSGGSRGMAALEGLVAAIELFDILDTSDAHPARPHVKHIFHIAASAPDTSINPQWNDSPSLDSVTWETLPSELRTRNINITTINLHQNLPRFPDLYLAVQGTSKDLPWFPVRPGHTVLLSSLPVPLQKSAKRAGEPHPTERTPDPKRLRLASQSALEASPKAGTPSTPSNAAKPSPVPPNVQISSHLPSQPSVPPSSMQTYTLPPNFTSSSQYQTFLNNARAIDEQIRNLQFSLQGARSVGNAPLAESLAQELHKKTLLQQKVRQTLMAVTAKAQAHAAAANQNQNQLNQGPAQIQGQGQGQGQGGGPAASLPNTLATLQSPQPTPSHDAPSGGPHFGADGRPDPQVLAQLMNHRSVSGSSTGPPGGVVPSAAGRVVSAPVAAQMQKLVEQTQRTRPDNISSQGASGSGQGQGMNAGVAAGKQGQTQSGPTSSEGVAKSSQLWQGSLTWSGTNPNGGKKEVTVYVVASTPNPSESQVETWPQAMSLAPIRSVPMPDLRLWLARFKPIMCTFAPQMHGVQDVQANAANLKTLVGLLASKNYYASASWTRPSGEQGSNALFLPTSHGLIGAIFPVTGLPELPKSSSIPGLPAIVLERMQQMPPDQMELVLMQWRKHREGATTNQSAPTAASGGAGDSGNNTSSFGSSVSTSQNQLQQQSGGAGLSTFAGNAHPSDNHGGGLNVMSNMGIGLGQPHNMMGLSANLPRPVSVGGGSAQSGVGAGAGIAPGSVSFEMIKSFIQRGGGNVGIAGQGQIQ